ncbi:hypothetical protein [Azohydromonas aeria]|uniref:hypothetical protein n=1 Tax=Azohydromonas aeria TaxID=2590212 RepID=UPI0012FC03E5|nr:hypothetical protein [Azohydromonas aeria]
MPVEIQELEVRAQAEPPPPPPSGAAESAAAAADIDEHALRAALRREAWRQERLLAD